MSLSSPQEFGPRTITTSSCLQTIGVLAWLSFWSTYPVAIILMSYVIVFTRYWYVGCLYCAWIYFDRHTSCNGGRRWNYKFRLPFPRWYTNYFPVTLVKTQDLDPSKNYLFCCHPHGIIACGGSVVGATDANNTHLAFPGLQTWYLTLHQSFYVPFFRELLLTTGGCSVNREGIDALLRKPGGGNIAMLLPGGAKEAVHSRPGEDTVVLKHRKGFIRVAIENGAPLVPVYSFGETDTYDQPSYPEGSLARKIQELSIERLGFLLTRIYGRGLFGLLPRRVPINVVVGPPIDVTQNICPTMEEVNDLHEKYIAALAKLYYTHRKRYGNPSSELKIL